MIERQKYLVSSVGSSESYLAQISYSIFEANVSNEHQSPGASQALVPRSKHKWSATVSWKDSCRWLYIYVHTYIDQSIGKNLSTWAELISILFVILHFSTSIFSSPGHHDSCGWAGAENNYPIYGGNCGLQLGSQLTGEKKLITVDSQVRNKIFSCDPPRIFYYLFIYNKALMSV